LEQDKIMTVLLLAEHSNAVLSIETAKALTAARAIDGDVHLLVAGFGVKALANAAARLDGVTKVLVADDATLEHQLAEPLAALIISLAGNYDAIAAPASSTGKNVMPRVAALLDVMQVSDVIAVLTSDTFKRPVYAGNAIQTVQSTDAKKVLTIRTTAFPEASQGGAATVESVPVPAVEALSRHVEWARTRSDRPELGSARVVVSGGRAFASREKFEDLLGPLAEKLGAAIGATRAAVDAGYAPNDMQVGQTGKVVAPELYIACGISGAIQHLAGIKDAKVIVAINKDADAPIFAVADYGLVGDVFELVPELTREL
jgi:electron transfer flavoprotein alpha subunit